MASSLPTYDISKLPRGYGLIIVNKFEKNPSMRRAGADQEIANLRNLFESLGLKTAVYTDKTKYEIQTALQLTSQCADLKEHSMIAIAISSHGDESGLYGVDVDQNDPNPGKFAISTKEIKAYFNSKNCPSLEDKPKLFFLNGCRGGKREEAHYSSKADGIGYTMDESDSLTIHSAVPGYAAMRHPEYGSVFIEVLCETLLRYHGHDIADLIPVVNRELMERANRIEDIDGVKVKVTETCIAEHKLRKKLCLTRVAIVESTTGAEQS